MKPELEQKLKEIWQESLDQNALAVHVMTRLMLTNYQNGTHGDFAKLCTRYMNDLQLEATIKGENERLMAEFQFDSGTKEWIC